MSTLLIGWTFPVSDRKKKCILPGAGVTETPQEILYQFLINLGCVNSTIKFSVASNLY